MLFLLLSPLLFVPSYGQDTITESDTCYLFYPHTVPLWAYQGAMSGVDSIIWENIVSTDTWIYGVSIRGDFPMDSTVYVYLTKSLKDSIPFYSDTAFIDSFAVQNYFKCRVDGEVHHPENGPFDFVEKCNEIYFHRPWLMQDTFYIFINYGWPEPSYSGTARLFPRGDTLFPQSWACWIGSYTGLQPVVTEGRCYCNFLESCEWGQEFPILEPNRTRCHKPTGVRFADRGDTWAVLSWNGGSGDRYRVTLEGPGGAAVYETADTALLLDSLQPDASYWVEVRSMCRYQYKDFDSTFVNPGKVRMGFHTSSAGVEELGTAPRIELHPNPAHDRVEVVSSWEMTLIEVVDALGRVAGSFPQGGATTAALDLTALPRGACLLRIHTPLGTATKKLLLQ